jgi:glycosyltransferase involved in cell wall biosynthesis
LRHLRRADQILAVSERVRDSLLALPFRIPPSRVAVFENAVDDTVFSFSSDSRHALRDGWGVAWDEPVYLSAGRLAADKGVDTAIRLVSQRERGRLVVAGHGPYEAELRDLCADLGLGNRVIFLGRVDRAQLAGVMSAADQFVFPTRRAEGRPMVLLEAAANGLPVIASPSAGIPDDMVGSGASVISPKDMHQHMVSDVSDSRQRTSYLPQRYSTEGLSARLAVHLAEHI